MRLVLALVAFATLAACGPIQSTAALIDADVEIEAARSAGADRAAPYEFTGAVAYLKKAREVTGYAQYEAGARFARKSAELAKEARTKAVEASNKGQENP